MRSLIVVLCVASAPFATRAQSLVPLSEPTRSADGSVCVAEGTLRVCRTSADEGGLVVVAREGRETGRWAASRPGIYEDLRVFRLGEDRLLVAVLDAVSNGLGVATWTVYVTDGEHVAYRFVARDFDPDGGSFGHWKGRPVLWATEWQDSDDPSGRRGRGYYLIGRPFWVEADELAPVTDLPVRARRLLHSFDRGPGGPVAWLSDRRAETRRRDPFWSETPSGRRAVISTVEVTSGTPRVTVQMPGLEVEVVLTRQTGSLDDAQRAGRLADGPSGRLYPEGYVRATLTGRRLQLGPGPERSSILWLD